MGQQVNKNSKVKNLSESDCTRHWCYYYILFIHYIRFIRFIRIFLVFSPLLLDSSLLSEMRLIIIYLASLIITLTSFNKDISGLRK